MRTAAPLDALVASVRGTPKYRAVCEAAVRNIGARELAKGRRLKDAIEATRNALHQAAGAYLDARPRYDRWLALPWRDMRGDALKAACAPLLAQHASTRERLPILDGFYRDLFAGLENVSRVLDVACGLNPLTRPWMPLAADAEYVACDLYEDQAAFISAWDDATGLRGTAVACDALAADDPLFERSYDVALLLKCLPVFDQLDSAAAARLLDRIHAPVLVVSYPVASLGGRRRNMPENYEARFMAVAAARGWQVRKHAFVTELAFVATRG